MNIEYEKKSRTSFSDIAIGEVFRYDTDIYIKVDPTDESGIKLDVNAVDLCRGDLRCIPSYVEVEFFNATLKLSN